MLLCPYYESPELPDISLPILEKCLAKYYGSYENLYKKDDELGECVLYSLVFGMSYEVIDLEYSERTFSEVMFGLVHEFRSQNLIVKLKKEKGEKSKAKESFVEEDTDYNVILTFPSKHVQLALVWDWFKANNPKTLMDKLEFGTSSFMWKNQEFIEEYCFHEGVTMDRCYYMTGEELCLNFDQVVVMYNMFPRHHRQLMLRSEFIRKGDFYIFEAPSFLEIHIEIIQENPNGLMNMILYSLKEDSLSELGSISPSKIKLRETLRFVNNSMITTLSPGLYLLRCTLKTSLPSLELFSDLEPPTIRITSTKKIKSVKPIEEEDFGKKFLKMHFDLVLKTIEQNDLKNGLFFYRGTAQLDKRHYYVVIENKSASETPKVRVRLSGFLNCRQSKGKSSMLIKENEETLLIIEPKSTISFIFNEIDTESAVFPSVQAEIQKEEKSKTFMKLSKKD